MSDSAGPTPEVAAPRRKSKRRWARRVLIGLLILTALVAVVTQAVLWTDFPRKLVLGLVEKELGLRVEAASLSTGWLGHTTLREVRLSLPLKADEAFFDVPTMRVSHTALIPLAVTRKFGLDAITLENPNLIVRRDPNSGRWNVQDVLELVAKAAAGKPDPQRSSSPPKLPRLTLTNGVVRVIERDGRESRIAPLTLNGYAEGPLVYRYDATVPERLKLVGQVAPGENWKHELNVSAKPGPWLTPWVPTPPDPLELNAQWSGMLSDDKKGVAGRLVIEDAKYQGYRANGRVAAKFGGGDVSVASATGVRDERAMLASVTDFNSGRGGARSSAGAGGGEINIGAAAGANATVLNPQGLTILTPYPAMPDVRLDSGEVRLAPSGMKMLLSRIRVTALGGEAQLDGEADLVARSADVRGQWVEMAAPGASAATDVRHRGDIALSVRSPFPGGPVINGMLTTTGRTPRGNWSGEIRVEGVGVTAPQPVGLTAIAAPEGVPTPPLATQPVATQPVATQPVATQPVATQPVATPAIATAAVAATTRETSVATTARTAVATTLPATQSAPPRPGAVARENETSAPSPWSNIDWRVTLARAAWDGKTDAALQDLSVRLAQRGEQVRLADVQWPGHHVTATGFYDNRTKVWSLRFDGRDTLGTTFDFNCVASGDGRISRLEQLGINARQAEFKAHGVLDMEKPEPVLLTVYLTHLPERLVTGERVDDPPLRGLLLAETQVQGTINPVALNISGSVRARKLIAFGRDCGDIDGDLKGAIRGQGAVPESAFIDVTNLKLLGGTWHANAVWPYVGSDTMTATPEPLRVSVDVNRLAMKDVGELLNLSGAAGGSASGEWTIDIPLPREPGRGSLEDQIVMRGGFRGEQIAVANGAFSADQVVGEMMLRNGVLWAHPITLSKAIAEDAPSTGPATQPATGPTLEAAARDVKIVGEGTAASAPATSGVADAGPARGGTATVNVQATLARLRSPSIAVDAHGWPVKLGSGSAAVWAQTHLVLNVGANSTTAAGAESGSTRAGENTAGGSGGGGSAGSNAGGGGAKLSATGPISVRAKLATTQAAVGEVVLAGKIEGRRAVLDTITFDAAYGGRAEGKAVIDADAPNSTAATLTWSGVEGVRLARLIPQLDGLSGTFSGEAKVAPAPPDSRALEPLRITIESNVSPDARFRTVALGPARLSAFANISSGFVVERAVLDQLPSELRAFRDASDAAVAAATTAPATQRHGRDALTAAALAASIRLEQPVGWNEIRLAGGQVKLWARRAKHAGGALQTHVIVDYRRLDLNELVHAFEAEADALPAKLSGQVVIHGDPQVRDEIFGQGRLNITESDLAKLDALTLLYNVVGLGSSPPGPIGHGSVSFSLQRGVLTLDDAYYFNRGVEAWSNGLRIGNVWDIRNSPISGYVVGSARPLSALKLPFLADVDQIMAVLQSGLTTVKLGGTIKHPKNEQATFADVGEGFKRLMRGKITNAQAK